jgi:iron(III) transport system permease protein
MSVAGVHPLRDRPRIQLRLPRPRNPVAMLTLFAAAALVAAPLTSLASIALTGDAEIWEHLVTYVLAPALIDTALLLAGVTCVATVLGVGTAWLVTTFEFPGRDALLWLLPLPLAIPTYIVAYVYVDLLDAWGPVQVALRAAAGWQSPSQYWFPSVRSLPGAVLLMGFVLYPYVYLAARAALQAQNPALIEAARMLGATPRRIARDVTLPLARPAVVAGLTLVLLETLNDIGLSEYLGIRTLTLAIFTTWLNRASLPGAAQIACMLLVVVATLIAAERYTRRNRRYASGDSSPAPRRRVALSGRRAWLVAAVCLVPVVFGFLVPLTHLSIEVMLRSTALGIDRDLLRHAVTSLAAAAVATPLLLAIGLAAVSATRFIRSRYADSCLSFAGLGYAIPGTVLALGLLTPILAADRGIDWLMRSATGATVGLVLMGSGGAVVIAYVVRFLAIVLGMTRAAFGHISTDLDDAARGMGARPAKVALSIHTPLARAALAGAALLVFVDCLKELPATLLLRPLNVETLSTYLYQFAARGSFEDGALAALLIVMAGILPVVRIVRLADRTEHQRQSAGID